MKSFLLLFSLTFALAFTSCRKSEANADVSFAENTFDALVRGDSSVASDIDWETLTSLGVPVGSQYLAIKTEAEKESFRQGFITQFSASFRNEGGSSDSFTNWRATSGDDKNTVVTADSSAGSLRLTVSERDSQKRLSAMEIVE